MKNIQDRIILWLRDYINDNGLSHFVVGVSGGIDSAVTSTLCALTRKPVVAVSLPILQNKDQLSRANKHIAWLKNNFSNVVATEIDLTDIYNCFFKTFKDSFSNDLAFANSRSRIRMVALYQIATYYNGLVVGTGNKVEDFGVGFFTKYGDGGVDISPIADLYKSQVKELARNLQIDDSIIAAQPTDGLWDDDRCDEDQIGATYEELEWAMNCNSTENLSYRQNEVLQIYKNFNTKNKHKMISIPTFKL